MKRRIFARILFAGLFVTMGLIPGDAADVVEILLHGRYFMEPATVRFTVAVEPDEANRRLRVEADSADLFRASEFALNGADEKRLHSIVFKSLPAGYYTLRAQVLSGKDVRGMATHELVVTGSGLR